MIIMKKACAPSLQVMPDLNEEEYAALRYDIERHGVMVPIVVDQHGRILDGHHRDQIATELGIEAPREVRHVADDGEAYELALTLNMARRHLNREQKRALIRSEIERIPDASDREIAWRTASSPSTVGAVRRRVSNLDTPLSDEDREELADAEARIERANEIVEEARARRWELLSKLDTERTYHDWVRDAREGRHGLDDLESELHDHWGEWQDDAMGETPEETWQRVEWAVDITQQIRDRLTALGEDSQELRTMINAHLDSSVPPSEVLESITGGEDDPGWRIVRGMIDDWVLANLPQKREGRTWRDNAYGYGALSRMLGYED
jgi:ParB-like chromosome segregation protein Spo0J